MSYRLLAVDMDDTLLKGDLSISERTREVLIQAQKFGLRLVLASGRPTGALWPFAKQLELPRYDGFLMGYNGGELTSAQTEKRLFEAALTFDEQFALFDLSRVEGTSILGYQDGAIVVPEESPWATIEHQLTHLPIQVVPDFKKAFARPSPKVIFVQEPERLAEVALKIHDKLPPGLLAAFSKPFFWEVTPAGVDKGQTLARLADHLGLASRQVMAAGDSFNDLPMIEWAGLGIAMANGRDEVKAKADFVTLSNEDDGVAEAVERYFEPCAIG